MTEELRGHFWLLIAATSGVVTTATVSSMREEYCSSRASVGAIHVLARFVRDKPQVL